ncbi:DUF6409 family protein [Pseudonocardia sp. CA-107938]|uniref:DUF6409 family protein n=1 Tax=Pseudonocardia sp. CA-107938 TaxID=3240021 RepID=UPI003D8CDE6F
MAETRKGRAMTDTNTDATLPAAGSVITARPWTSGRRHAAAQRRIVLRTDQLGGAAAIVWFPTLGAPQVGTPAPSVQAIYPAEIETVAILDDVPASWVIAAERTARLTRRTGGLSIGAGAGFPLESAARRRRAERNQRRHAGHGAA